MYVFVCFENIGIIIILITYNLIKMYGVLRKDKKKIETDNESESKSFPPLFKFVDSNKDKLEDKLNDVVLKINSNNSSISKSISSLKNEISEMSSNNFAQLQEQLDILNDSVSKNLKKIVKVKSKNSEIYYPYFYDFSFKTHSSLTIINEFSIECKCELLMLMDDQPIIMFPFETKPIDYSLTEGKISIVSETTGLSIDGFLKSKIINDGYLYWIIIPTIINPDIYSWTYEL